jgi:hypothetical protein
MPSPEVAEAEERFSSEWPFVARVSGFPVSAPVGVPLCVRVAVVNATGRALRLAPGSRIGVEVGVRHDGVSGTDRYCWVAADLSPCPDERCEQPTPGRWWTTQSVVLRCIPLVEGVVHLRVEVDTSHLRFLRAPKGQLDEATLLRRYPWLGHDSVAVNLVSPDTGFRPTLALMGGQASAHHAETLLADEPGSVDAAFTLHYYLEGLLERNLRPIQELEVGHPASFVAAGVCLYPDAEPHDPAPLTEVARWHSDLIRTVTRAKRGLWFEGELMLVAGAHCLVSGDYAQAREWLDAASRDPHPWVSQLAERLISRMRSQEWRMRVDYRNVRIVIE